MAQLQEPITEFGCQIDELQTVHGELTILHDRAGPGVGGYGRQFQFHFLSHLQRHGGREGQSGFADFKAGGVVCFPAALLDGQRLNKTVSRMPALGAPVVTRVAMTAAARATAIDPLRAGTMPGIIIPP